MAFVFLILVFFTDQRGVSDKHFLLSFFSLFHYIRPWGANRPPCSISGIFLGSDFLKAHPKSCKIRHVSTLAIGTFTCGGLLRMLPIRLFMVFYRFVVILAVSLFFGLVYGSEHWIIPWIYVTILIFVRMVNCNVENKHNLQLISKLTLFQIFGH